MATLPTFTGRPVSNGPVRRIAEALNDDGLRAIATAHEQLAAPEPPEQHIKNALQILISAYVDEHGARELTAAEYHGVVTRLQHAAKQIEGGLA